MSTFLYEPLRAGKSLTHFFKLTKAERYQVAGVYPYLYLVGNPDGVFKFELKRNEVVLISKTFTSADLRASVTATLGAIRVWFPILPNKPLPLNNTVYSATLSADSGYNPDYQTSGLGWIRPHENLNNVLGYVAADHGHNPKGLRIKEYKPGHL